MPLAQPVVADRPAAPPKPARHLRMLLWWLPPLMFALAGRFVDPVGTIRTGDVEYSRREAISYWLFAAASAYVLISLLSRAIRWAVVLLRTSLASEEGP
jgi:hypothetical protein